jgi:hypothetical protein
MLILRLLFTCVLFCLIHQPAEGVTYIDSLKMVQEKLYQDYQLDRSAMKDRTWVRLVEVDRKANELIEINRVLIEELSELSSTEKSNFLENMNNLLLEKALVEREMEVQETALNRKTRFQKTLVTGSITAGTLFLIALILLISLSTRYRAARRELERLYSFSGESKNVENQDDVKQLTNNNLMMMKENNEKLKKELTRVSGEKSEAVEALKKEIRDRKKMEEEIRILIEQIKKQ